MSKFFYLIITIIFLVLASVSSISAQDVLLDDDFDSNLLNSAVWSSGGCCGGGVTINNGIVEIDGGTQSGGGYAITTLTSFPIDANTILTLELRAFNTDPNGGLFMFWKQQANQWKAVGFRTKSPGTFNATARASFDGPLQQTELVLNVDITQWHIYRVEYQIDVARYYVDGILVAEITSNIPQVSDIPVSFSGQNRLNTQSTLNVDWVKVTSSPIITNNPPDCSSAVASQDFLWPPQHQLENVNILGVTDPDNDAISITIDSISQDEPTNGTGDGDVTPDGFGLETSTAVIRAERAGDGNGRIYRIAYTATDSNNAECSGEVLVGVNHDQGKKGNAVNDGTIYDSTTIVS